MTDIPQEVREVAATFVKRAGGASYELIRKGQGDHLPITQALHAMFLAGKRAGAEEEKRHQDFVTATAYECGHKAGMERAAEIAEDAHNATGLRWTPKAIAQAIRSENDGHG